MLRVAVGLGALVASLVALELWSVTRDGDAPADATPRVVCQTLSCAEITSALGGGAVIAWPSVAANPKYSLIAADAGSRASTPSDAEAIAALRPTLVVVAPYSRADTLQHIKALGIATLNLAEPETLDQLRHNVRALAAAVGREAEGARLLDALDQRLRKLPATAPRRVVAWVAGATAGPGTTVDVAIRAAGHSNGAALPGWNTVDQEALAALGADILLVSRDVGETDSALEQRLLGTYPVVAAQVARGLRLVGVPGALLGTASHHLVTLAELIGAAAKGP